MAFREVTKRLANTVRKAKAEYCVIGALAVGYYGIPRSTKEIEMLMFPSWVSVKDTISNLRKSGFRTIGRIGKEPKDFRAEAKEGYRVRFTMAKSKSDIEVIRRGKKVRFFGTVLKLASPEDLVIFGLLRGDVKGTTDAVGVLVRQSGSLDEGYLKQRAKEAGVADVFNELVKKLF